MNNTKAKYILLALLFIFLFCTLADNILVRILFLSLFICILVIFKKDIIDFILRNYTDGKYIKINKDIKDLEKTKLSLKNNLSNLYKINDKENCLKEEIIEYSEKSKLLSNQISKNSNELDKIKDYIHKKTIEKKDLDENISSLLTKKALLIQEINSLTDQKFELKKQIELLQPKIPVLSKITMKQIDEMNPFKFEYLTKVLLEKLDYNNVVLTNDSNDYGIDVLAEQDGIKYGFQCKHYSGNVGIAAVQQAYAGIQHYGCNIGIVITNSSFTKQAQKQAKETNIILWDRKKLMDKLSETNYSFNINL